ncbi:MAG: hypothetical protein K9L17_10920 [Clostridiales bacterium]|nr:hypothetical protein [Clostridiales bacterium]MCF8023193.1 hypothetical protein [Clostridiales bacterium]
MKGFDNLQELIEKNKRIKDRGGLSRKTARMPAERNDRVGRLKKRKEKVIEKLEKTS